MKYIEECCILIGVAVLRYFMQALGGRKGGCSDQENMYKEKGFSVHILAIFYKGVA